MKTWKIEITMRVSDSWIEDGFNLKERIDSGEVSELMTGMLPHAYDHEVTAKVKIISAPDPKKIEELQGYLLPLDRCPPKLIKE